MKTSNNFQVSSKLLWNCHDSVVKVTENNRVQLIWVLGHVGCDGNEITVQLATEGTLHPLTGPEAALDIYAEFVIVVIRD